MKLLSNPVFVNFLPDPDIVQAAMTRLRRTLATKAKPIRRSKTPQESVPIVTVAAEAAAAAVSSSSATTTNVGETWQHRERKLGRSKY